MHCLELTYLHKFQKPVPRGGAKAESNLDGREAFARRTSLNGLGLWRKSSGVDHLEEIVIV